MSVGEICRWLREIAAGCSGSWGDGATVICSIARVSKKSGEVLRMVTEWMRTNREDCDDVTSKRLLLNEHPFTKLLIQSVSGQIALYGDGGWLTLSVATDFVMRYPSITPSLIPHSITLCGRWTDEFFSTMNYSINTSSAKHLLTVAANMFGSSAQMLGISQTEIAWLSSLYVQQFLSSINEETEMLSPSLMRYKFVATQQASFLDSFLLPQAVIDWDIPIEYKLIAGKKTIEKYKNKNVTIALFDFCLEPDSTSENEIVTEKSNGDVNEMTNLMTLMTTLVNHKVGIVASQKTIHRTARYYLAHNGILALERLSIYHIDVVRLISKSTIITNTNSNKICKDYFGTITNFETLSLSKSTSKISIALSGIVPIQTLIIKHVSKHVHSELELIFKNLTKSLIAHMADPRVGPGAGITEFLLSEYLSNKCVHIETATTEPGISNLAPFMRSEIHSVIKMFASVIKNIAREKSKQNSLFESGNNFNSKEQQRALSNSMGVDPMNKSVCGVVKFGPRPPSGTVFRDGRSIVPSKKITQPGIELGGVLPSLPNQIQYYSTRYPDVTNSVIASFDDDGVLITNDDEENDHLLPIVDSVPATRAAIVNALDVAAMIIRTDALVIDTN